MLEGVRQIGKTYRGSVEGGFAFSLIKEVEQRKETQSKKHLLRLDFWPKEDNLELSFLEINERTSGEYLWVGHRKGNVPQDRLTASNVQYILFGSLFNLKNSLPKGRLKETLEELVKRFFVQVKVKDKTLQVLDFRKIKGFPPDVPWPPREEPKKFQSEYKKIFFRHLKDSFGFSEDDFGLFAITIEGKKPSEIEEYVAYLEQAMIEEQFEESLHGICSVCGQKEELTWDTTSFPDKFYITKLIIFSSELLGKKGKEGFAKNFALCRECYRELLTGMNYLRNYLNTQLAGNTLYLIPGLFFHPVGKTLTEKWMDFSKRYFTSTFTPEAFLEFEEKVEQKLEDYREFEELIDYTYVDLLFYSINQSAFKIKKLIREVPLRRVRAIKGVFREVQKLGEELLGNGKDWFLSLNGMYYLLPIRSGEEVEHRKILELYESLFLGYPVDRKILVRFFLTLAQVCFFERQGYNVKPGSKP
ncbi:MAG: TIGR02556 family CRISPR-associated protein, partial [Atribacterota bacterium]